MKKKKRRKEEKKEDSNIGYLGSGPESPTKDTSYPCLNWLTLSLRERRKKRKKKRKERNLGPELQSPTNSRLTHALTRLMSPFTKEKEKKKRRTEEKKNRRKEEKKNTRVLSLSISSNT